MFQGSCIIFRKRNWKSMTLNIPKQFKVPNIYLHYLAYFPFWIPSLFCSTLHPSFPSLLGSFVPSPSLQCFLLWLEVRSRERVLMHSFWFLEPRKASIMSKSRSGETPLWRRKPIPREGASSFATFVHGHPIRCPICLNFDHFQHSVPCLVYIFSVFTLFFSPNREKQWGSHFDCVNVDLTKGGETEEWEIGRKVHGKWPFNARSYRINLNVQFHVFHSSPLAQNWAEHCPSLPSHSVPLLHNFETCLPLCSLSVPSLHYISFQCLSFIPSFFLLSWTTHQLSANGKALNVFPPPLFYSILTLF